MAVFKSKFPDVDIPEMAVVEFIMQHFDRYGDSVAMVDGIQGHFYTYNQVKSLARKIHCGLVSMGFKHGDVFAIYSPNNPEFALVLLGVLSAGGVVTTLNPSYTVDELVHQLSNSEAKYIITVPANVDKTLQAKKHLPNLKEVFVFGEAPGCKPYLSLLNNDGKCPPRTKVNPDDVVVLLYSSGTTGLSKGVVLTHRNIISSMCQCMSEYFLNMRDGTHCLLALLPFYHIYGLSIILMQGLHQGTKLVTLPQFQPESFLRTIQDHRVTVVNLVPPIMVFLAKSPLVDKYDLSSVQRVTAGAAPVSSDIAKTVASKVGVSCVMQGYGLTETACAATILPNNVIHFGSTGALLPNTEMKIVDIKTQKPLPPYKDGEIWLKGPQLMKGYLKNPKATAECIDKDGFFHTGDIGHIDEEGYLWIVDRLKELIKYKGYQVPPAELEALLLTHSGILDAAVIGIPDEVAGELPRAYVVKKTESLTAKDVQKFVAEKVAPHKHLRGGVVFVGQIPKSASGKILKRDIRKQLQSRM